VKSIVWNKSILLEAKEEEKKYMNILYETYKMKIKQEKDMVGYHKKLLDEMQSRFGTCLQEQ